MPPEVVAMALSGRTLYSNQRLASILPPGGYNRESFRRFETRIKSVTAFGSREAGNETQKW